MNTLRDIIQKEFGVEVDVNINPLVSSVGTSAVEVLGNNPNRLAATIVNLGSNEIYLSIDESVSSTAGIRLNGGGGKFGLYWNEDFDLTGYAWNAVTATGTSTIYVVEVVARQS